ncbi:hypothetical protein QJS04_geneDACA005398 [Acorus gramineus]|uniref:Uncharacterized protein n=1 Tax=Acorus gramineus TaxID=55184 RepID=A0AAV9AZ31_ACOGR|nr:hypothetical protein QJS04_geneDACA005398 [Acorus gramineus]
MEPAVTSRHGRGEIGCNFNPIDVVSHSHVHFFQAIKGGSVIKVRNIDYFERPAFRFKDINAIYESETGKFNLRSRSQRNRNRNSVSSNPIMLGYSLSDECDFDGGVSIGDGVVDGYAPGSDRNPPCKNGGNGEPNDINFNALTLMELRARCKAKKRKALNPVKSEISEDESLNCDDVSKNGHVHLKEVNLEEPLINMKLKALKKCTSERKRRKKTQNPLDMSDIPIVAATDRELKNQGHSMQSTGNLHVPCNIKIEIMEVDTLDSTSSISVADDLTSKSPVDVAFPCVSSAEVSGTIDVIGSIEPSESSVERDIGHLCGLSEVQIENVESDTLDRQSKILDAGCSVSCCQSEKQTWKFVQGIAAQENHMACEIESDNISSAREIYGSFDSASECNKKFDLPGDSHAELPERDIGGDVIIGELHSFTGGLLECPVNGASNEYVELDNLVSSHIVKENSEVITSLNSLETAAAQGAPFYPPANEPTTEPVYSGSPNSEFTAISLSSENSISSTPAIPEELSLFQTQRGTKSEILDSPTVSSFHVTERKGETDYFEPTMEVECARISNEQIPSESKSTATHGKNPQSDAHISQASEEVLVSSNCEEPQQFNKNEPGSNCFNVGSYSVEADDLMEHKPDVGFKNYPTKLFSTRKTISPTSQEKLRRVAHAAESNANAELSKSRKRVWYDECPKNKISSSIAGHEEGEAEVSPEKGIKKLEEDNDRSPTPVTRGILKSSHSSCTNCSFIHDQTDKVITFSQRQMKDIEVLALKLLRGLNSMRDIVRENLLEACPSADSKYTVDEMRLASEEASQLEAKTRKYLSVMTKDCHRFCKIMKSAETKAPTIMSKDQNSRKKITFADEAGGLLCQVKIFHEQPAPAMVSENDS